MGCWISVCTSVMSPLEVARTRMLDAIGPILLTAAAADGDLDLFGRAVELAVGLHDRGHVAGLGHLQPVGDTWDRAVWNLVGSSERVRVLRHEERNRGHLVERR